MIFSPVSLSRGRAPIPSPLPGQFFVLEFARDDRTYVLHVDDDGHSTFALGDDVEQVIRTFTARGYLRSKVCDLVDRAREFGACQYIPSPLSSDEDRLIQLTPRTAATPTLRLFEDQNDVSWNRLR